ncbi:MAG: hypothetical protein A2078_04320 [Nitrospirae bacterium GWC2_57_9]|nr:MAG: hypothetical protein A2078_04320 [Nitrospirae bacterium GWC2_57_9]
MNYSEIIRRVRMLDFIRNDEKAAAAVKAVLGILACRLSDEQARKLAEKFPETLAQDRAGSDYQRMKMVSFKEYNDAICSQFKLSLHQARILTRTVLYFAKEASGDNAILDFKKNLPNDWAEAIQNA